MSAISDEMPKILLFSFALAQERPHTTTKQNKEYALNEMRT
jgi:hypothetical protein